MTTATTRKPAVTTSAQPVNLAAYWPGASALDLAAIGTQACETGRPITDVAVEALETFAADCLQAAEQIDAEAQRHAGNNGPLNPRVLPLETAARKLFGSEVRSTTEQDLTVDGRTVKQPAGPESDERTKDLGELPAGLDACHLDVAGQPETFGYHVGRPAAIGRLRRLAKIHDAVGIAISDLAQS